MGLALNLNLHIMEEFKMKTRTVESNTRMRYLLGNNPMGEMVKIVLSKCKKVKKREHEVRIKN